MSRLQQAISRVAQAQRRYNEAFEELSKAAIAMSEIVKQEQDQQWLEITKASVGKSRRPKGEVQQIITTVFQQGTPGPLSFNEIYEAVKLRNITAPSPSTVRQTLYRMRKQNVLECYSGRWAPGIKLKK